MFGNLLFGLTTLTCIALADFNIQKRNITMLKLQEALDAPPLEQPNTDKDFIVFRNSCWLVVKNWLDAH